MSTRLKKKLGYGFIGTPEHPLSEIVNHNKASEMQDAWGRGMWEDIRHYKNMWVEANPDKILFSSAYYTEAIAPDAKPPHGYNLLTYEVNGGGPGTLENDVIMITPPYEVTNWYRMSDDIDHAELSIKGEYDMRDEAHYIKEGFYPYSSTFIDVETFKRITNQDVFIFERERAAYEKGEKNIYDIEELAQRLGYETAEQARARIARMPAADAIMIAQHFEIFNNPDDAYRMKSIYYKYWS